MVAARSVYFLALIILGEDLEPIEEETLIELFGKLKVLCLPNGYSRVAGPMLQSSSTVPGLLLFGN
jgi:hypothetical protein